jgi:hypothetical protein
VVKRKRRQDRRSASSRAGELPGEYTKRSTISLRPSNWVAEGVIELDGVRVAENHYIVTTSRLDGEWKVEVATQLSSGDAQRTVLPGAVVERIQSHMRGIITDQRADRSRDIANRRIAETGQVFGQEVEPNLTLLDSREA